jgi:hypothetical protein
MTESKYFYVCPDCDNMFDAASMHQHENGEWIKGETLAEFYQTRRWIGKEKQEFLKEQILKMEKPNV